MKIRHFFDDATFTLTYVVYDEGTKTGVVIDTVTDFDPSSGRTGNSQNEKVAGFIDELGLAIPYALDTHAHADHFTGLAYFKDRYGCKTVIGRHITVVQATFRDIFNLGEDFPVDGSQFDVLIRQQGFSLAKHQVDHKQGQQRQGQILPPVDGQPTLDLAPSHARSTSP